MEHLQTPLTVEPYVGTSPTEADIVDADDEVIASGVQTSTARCFCKAVNCHNDLLAAIRGAQSLVQAYVPIDYQDQTCKNTCLAMIDAAIKKARKQ